MFGCAALWAQPSIQTIFGGSPDGLQALSATMNGPGAVAVDAQGFYYIGNRSGHQIVRIGPGGIINLIAGTGINGNSGDGGPATLANIGAPGGMTLDQAGNLFFSDNQASVVRRIDTSGVITTIAGTGKATPAGQYPKLGGDNGPAILATFNQPLQIAFDANGNLLVADAGNHAIRKISPDGTISLFAGNGNGTPGKGGDGQLAAYGSGLYAPFGVAVDNSGNVFITDSYNFTIRMVTPDGVIHLYAGLGQLGYRGDNGDASNAAFSTPGTLAFDQAGQLYINDQGNYRVRRIGNDNRIVTVAGSGTKGAEGDGGLAKSANIASVGIGLDSKNNLLLADGDNNRVRIVTVADGVIDTIAGNGVATYDPRYLLRNGDNVYFSDGNAQRLRLFNLSNGSVSIVAGTGSVGFAGDGDAAFNSTMKNPRGMAIDSAGNLYFADSGNHRVRKIDTNGNISTIAGTGTASSTGDSGSATLATINEPVDVAVDGSGNIYIAERSGQRVRKIAGGTITTIAGTGSGGPPDSETGVAINQRLNLPQGLYVEKGGSLLISDTGNNRVRRLTSDGTITTIAGIGAAGYDGDGGPATSALLNNPIGVTEDAAGNIYISDSSSQAIRQIGSDGIITTVAGLNAQTGSFRSGGFNGDGSPATSLMLNKPIGLVAASASCSVLVADSGNQRLRQVWAAVNYAVTTNPPGLQVTVDGQAPLTTPATVSFAPGSQHSIDVPAQDNGGGTRFLSTGAVNAGAGCDTPRTTVTVNLKTQYALTLTPDPGGTITALDLTTPASWQDSGSSLWIVATPTAGFTFTGWEGDCAGTDACMVTMDQPRTAIAHFAPMQ